MENEQTQQEALQQLEDRFTHTDINHPAIRKLYDIQLAALQNNQPE